MTKPRIELLYFEGCPNAPQARENIRAATALIFGTPLEWVEWDLTFVTTPVDLKEYGSPTVLIDGNDVTDVGPGYNGIGCRIDGAPSIDIIAAKLT